MTAPRRRAGVMLRRPFAAVMGSALLVGLAAGVALPFRETVPLYLDRAEALFHHGQHAPSSFAPTGYMTFLTAGVALGGRHGVMVLQALAYTALVCLAYAALRLLSMPSRYALVGAFVVGVHPFYLVSVNRIIEVSITTPLLLALVAVALWIRRDGLSWTRAIAFGLVIGCLDAVRPNLLSVVPVAIVLAWPRMRSWRSLGLVAALVPPVVSSMIMIGHPALISSNGPYNLAAGANAHTESALLHDYDAEPSLNFDLAHFHVRRLDQLYSPSKQSQLTSFGLHYIENHPADYVKLGGIKLFTAFRPDLRPSRIHSSFESLVEVIAALPILVWLLTIAAARRAGIRTDPLTPRLVLLFVALYLLPLALTNGHPRLRYPMDALLLLHVAAIGCRWVQGRAHLRRGEHAPQELTVPA